MDNYANIINSKIVPSEYDGFWEPLPQLLSGFTVKPVLVIVNDFPEGSNEETQLKKMMDGSKLVPEKYNILKIAEGQKASWRQIRQTLNPQIIFLIGIAPAQLGISSMFKINEPNSFNDRLWLPSYSLKDIDQHADIKTQLWKNGMKPVFVDKQYGEF